MYTAVGDYPNALASHKQCVQLVKQMGDRLQEAREIGNVGAVYLAMGEFESAVDCHTQHLRLARRLGNQVCCDQVWRTHGIQILAVCVLHLSVFSVCNSTCTWMLRNMIPWPWICCLHWVVMEDTVISVSAFVMSCIVWPVGIDICYEWWGRTFTIFVCLTKLGGAVY